MHEVLKPFSWSRDGVTALSAEVGDVVELPEHLAQGLVAERFAKPHVKPKAVERAPENKVIESAPENKAASEPGSRRGRRAAETK